MGKTQTIYVVLHDGTTEKVSIPAEVKDEKAIELMLSSRFGRQGWKSYKIREPNK